MVGEVWDREPVGIGNVACRSQGGWHGRDRKKIWIAQEVGVGGRGRSLGLIR